MALRVPCVKPPGAYLFRLLHTVLRDVQTFLMMPAPTMNSSIRFKLFLMMVLEFFIWGAWLPLIFGYLPSLGFTTTEQSWILNAFPIAAIVGMFFSNQYADRHFSAEKFLAFSHFVGGLALLGIATLKAPAPVPDLAAGQPNPNAPFAVFFTLMLVHC